MRKPVFTLMLAGLVAGCSTPTQPSSVPAGLPMGAGMSVGGATAAVPGGPASASGGGHFQLTLASGDVIAVQFGMNAVVTGGGGAVGHFTHSTALDGLAIEFQGRVTCLSVDAANRRAWIGGVVTRNTSDHPGFTTPRTQPGRDIWFRVLDNGQGRSDPDRSTFVGFEGDAGFITSQDYCDGMPWPDDDARTWPVTKGNLVVRP